jgi:hypothetical protein
MIPEFNEDSELPVGEHPATLDEVKERFCSNKCRSLFYSGLVKLIEDLKCIGCPFIYVGGGFVSGTNKPKGMVVWWENRQQIDWSEKGTDFELLLEKDPKFRQKMAYRAKVYPLDILGSIHSALFQTILLVNSETGHISGILKIDLTT